MQNHAKTDSRCEQHAHFERNNYYFGKMLTVRDFTDEQKYLNEKRWLLNRYGLGWGVLCGLQVRPGGAKNKVIVDPGFALDRYGNEIMVCQVHEVDLETAQEPPPGEEHRYKYYLYIQYHECPTEAAPIPVEDCGELKTDCVYNRTQETYQLKVSRQPLDFSNSLMPALTGALHCETDCYRFLENPAPLISAHSPKREKCAPVPLACICYNPATPTTALDIDNGYRKLAFSNEMLHEMLWCLQQELGKVNAAQPDRRRHVPLLTKTIKGLSYQNGKLVHLNVGKYPYRLTSDGDYIWITDREDRQVWRLERKTNKPIKNPELYLDAPTWGIAYDGLHMWITHHDEKKEGNNSWGTITRINVCTLEKWTITGLQLCDKMNPCQKFPENQNATTAVEKVKPYPGEIVWHDGYIYVAHPHAKATDTSSGKSVERYEFILSKIDPGKVCLVKVETIPIPEGQTPSSEIIGMASDGEALWLTYQAHTLKGGAKAILLRLDTATGKSETCELRGGEPKQMIFDGTRLWVSHDNGASAIDVLDETMEEDPVNTKECLSTLAYGGGEYVWASVVGQNEAQIKRIDIFTENVSDWVQVYQAESRQSAPYDISDMQFDGVYIYVAAHLTTASGKQGVIHRLLP